MTSIRAKKILITLLTITAIIAFGALFVRAFYYFPSEEIVLPAEMEDKFTTALGPEDSAELAVVKKDTKPASKKVVKAAVKETPSTKIIIPAIKVNAKIVDVGVTAKGNMASPKSFPQVGWYKYGPFPGETGSAVLAGHVNNGISLPAVFSKLDRLQTGDDIYVETKDGKKLHFKVIGRKIYAYDSTPEEVFMDQSGKYLKLITCVGQIIRELRTHDKRLVITAELIEA